MAWFVPASSLLLIFVIYPAIRTIGLAFSHKDPSSGFASEFAGLANFLRAATDSRFISSLWITFIFTAASVALEFGLGLLLALSAESVRKAQGLVRVILLIPWTLPTAVIAVLWGWMLNDQYGGVNLQAERVGSLG